MAVELASEARFADGVWLTLRADREAANEALADRRSEVVEVRVRAALVPKREVLLAGGRRGERILRLSNGVASEVADVVLVDLRFEAQLAFVVEQRARRLERDDVALLTREVEDRQ